MALLWFVLARLERARTDESGQSTAEYALVIVAAAALAGLLVSFLSKSNIVSSIFGKIVSFVTGHIL
jgi:Flp pilus assembly pilin Flp